MLTVFLQVWFNRLNDYVDDNSWFWSSFLRYYRIWLKVDAVYQRRRIGKNVVSGVMLDVSEKTATIVEGLRAFQLAQPSATLMTDGGSAYPEAASSCEMVRKTSESTIDCELWFWLDPILFVCIGAYIMYTTFPKRCVFILRFDGDISTIFQTARHVADL